MFIVGLAFGGVGFIALFTGVGLAASGENKITCDECELTDEQSAGIGLMLGGGASLAIGALLIGAGARSVPDQPSWAKAVPAVGIGPGSATLRWKF
jgi:drug/metabolite transporter (DMT)-like permease